MSREKTNYKQCRMEKRAESCGIIQQNGIMVHTAWIPEKFAKLHKVIKLLMKDRDGNEHWEDGWRITFVGESSVSYQDLPDSHAAIKNHRKATGDNLPKMK